MIHSKHTKSQFINTHEQQYQKKITRALELYQTQNIVSSYLYLKEIFTQFENEAKDCFAKQDNQQLKEYLDVILGLSFNNSHYKNKALAYISTIKNKALVDKLTFSLCVFMFINKEYKNCIDYTKDLSYENFNNQQAIYLKFIQAYSYLETQEYHKAFVLFDFIRQVSINNPFYADAYYYYSYLQIQINNNLKLALNGFYLIEHDKKYSQICPFYIANILYALNYKFNTQKYLEEKLSVANEYLYKTEMTDMLMQLYFENNQYNKIIANLGNQFKKNDGQNFYLGVSYFKLDSFEKAIEILTPLTEMSDSVSFEINFILSQIYLNKRSIELSNKHFLYCINHSIKSVFDDFILFMYAKTSLNLGQSDIALEKLQTLIKLYPTSKYIIEAKQLLILSYANSNNFKEAIKLLDEQIKITDKKVLSKIYFGRAMNFYAENKNDSTKFYLNKQLELLIEDSYTLLANQILGEQMYNKHLYDNAIYYFSAGINTKYKTDNTQDIKNTLMYHLAYCYFKREDYKQAINYFNQILQTDSVNKKNIDIKQDAQLRLGDAYFMSKKYVDANTLYTNYLNDLNNPNRDYASYQNAIIAGLNNPLDKIELLRTTLNIFPNSGLKKTILLEIGNTELATNKFEEAIQTFTKLLQLDEAKSFESIALLNIGLCYDNLNNDAKAIYFLKQVAEKFPKTPESVQALALLKEIYSNQGDAETFINIAQKSGQYTEEANADSLFFATAEIKFREKKYVEAYTLFTNYLVKFNNSIRKQEAWYYILNAAFYNKNYDVAFSIGDSIVNNNAVKYIEKSMLILVKIKDSTLLNKQQRLKNFTTLYNNAKTNENKLFAQRNLLYLYFELQAWQEALPIINDLQQAVNLTEQDQALMNIFIAKKYYQDTLLDKAVEKYLSIGKNKFPELEVLANYDLASIYFSQLLFDKAEKQAFFIIENYTQYYEYVLKSYLLLAEIYYKQKDIFNAKATLKSIIKNASIAFYKESAINRLSSIEQLERSAKSDTTQSPIMLK